MTRSHPAAAVLVLDFRTEEGRAFLETLNADTADALGLTSHVLVLDTTEDLAGHHGRYRRLALLPQVTGVVLLAVGPIRDGAAAPRLRVPKALQGLGVVLWVGHERGVRWTGGSQPPGAGQAESTVDELVLALRLPAVFEQVLTSVREMPHQVAGPGIEVDHAAVDPALLRTLRVRALRRFTATGTTARAHDRASAELAAVAGATGAQGAAEPAITPRSPLDELNRTAATRLTAARQAVQGVRARRALLDGGVARGVLPRLASAAQALVEQHGAVRRVLDDVESSLAEGYPPATELTERGLRPPAEVDAQELADALRTAFTAELVRGRTLPGLAAQARALGNRAGEGRGATPADDVPDPAPVLRTLADPPPLRLWPAPLAHVLPLVFLTCLAAAWLPASGVAAGPAAALLWAALTALLFARRPDRRATPLVPVALVAVLGAVGVAAGSALPAPWPVGVLVESSVLVVVLLVAVSGAVLTWRAAAGAWADAVRVERAAAFSRRLVEHVESVVRTRWTHAEHNRRLADSLYVVAVALDAVVEVFEDLIGYYRDDYDHTEVTSVDTATHLAEVLHHDLVALVAGVLRPCFNEIASHAPLSGDARRHLAAAREAVAEYNDHLENAGLRELPPGVTDDGPRRVLAATLWRGSEVGRRILRSGERSEMTQLCTANDIKLLNPGAAVVLHFASWDIDITSERAADVIRTSGDAVGVLRLTPLKTGLVEWSVERVEEAGA
ncbi:hypothetical protein AB0I60_20515 [Actinosynnema sp. NPDC050436]|uniref:hypothetical protein n=1 Tax=Actinosynnema sp. NPDC050436 TaxID=3155659 RepID=UPI0033F4245B